MTPTPDIRREIQYDDLMEAARLVDGPAHYDLALRLAGYAHALKSEATAPSPETL